MFVVWEYEADIRRLISSLNFGNLNLEGYSTTVSH